KQADTYDPNTQVFTETSNWPTNGTGNAAVLLPDATLLVTGGMSAGCPPPMPGCLIPLRMASRACPPLMLVPRANHAMTLMLDGKLLVSAGFSGSSPHDN